MGFGRGLRAGGLALGALTVGGTAAVAGDIDLAAAERQFKASCGTCHVVERDAPPRQGPPLAGVLGRPAGSLHGFGYSDALKGSGIVWTEETLERWIENAQAFVPGTTMLYRQANPHRRALIVAYLKSVAGTPD